MPLEALGIAKLSFGSLWGADRRGKWQVWLGIMPPKSTPLTQAAIRRMIKESVDVAIAAERARHANTGNDARGSGKVRGQDVAPMKVPYQITTFL
ncbi:hypothetical protein Tco_1310167 [Tanacetum coccineum]